MVNAGGIIINVAAEYLGETTADVEYLIEMIAGRVTQIMQRATKEGRSAHLVADELAQDLIEAGNRAAA